MQELHDCRKKTESYAVNILFLTSTLPRFDGDQQASFVLHQATAWKCARPNDDVRILAPHDIAAEKLEIRNGVTIQRFEYFRPNSLQRLAYPAILPNLRRNRWLAFLIPFFLLGEYRTAIRLIREHQIDVIYAHWVMPQGVIAYLLHKRTGVPFTLQNHSSDLSIFSSLPFGRSVARRVVGSAKVFFCVNREQLGNALSLFDGAVRKSVAKKCFVYPMGVTVSRSMARSCDLEASSSSQYKRDFGVISRLSRKKGIEYFIAALEKLDSKSIRYRAGIAGDGEFASELRAAGVKCGVEFLGFLDGEDKAEFFCSTRFFVFPSVVDGQDVEGMPVALLEAMYCGKLVAASAATNIKLLPEWNEIKNGVFLLDDVRAADQFSKVLERMLALSDNDIRRISTALSAAIGKYEWRKLIHKYIEPVLS